MSVEGKACKLNKILKVSILFLITILIFSFTLGVNVINISILNKASASSDVSSTDGDDNDSIWEQKDLGSYFIAQEKLVIGDGRDDGINRIYSACGIHGVGPIYELSFNNSKWEKKSIRGDDPYPGCVYGLAIGNFRNDGTNGVYASIFDLTEYRYDSNSWTWNIKGPSINWCDDIILGNARNDDYMRIYAAGSGKIYEISYDYGDWNSINIDTGGQLVQKLFITDGRNDGISRLYAAVNGNIHEFTWSGSTWEEIDCGKVGDEYYEYCGMSGGNGRNDGKNRMYLASGGLYELTYNGKNWDKVVIAGPNEICTVTIADGNDGVNCLYTGSSKGIGEYTFIDGVWKKTANYDTKYKVNDLVVGQGRNDRVNRIYVAGDDNHIYEYSFTENTEVTPIKSPETELINPMKTGNGTKTDTRDETGTKERIKPQENVPILETIHDIFDIDFLKNLISESIVAFITGLIGLIGTIVVTIYLNRRANEKK